MHLPRSSTFAYVPENKNSFLKLFSHRFDYIWAPHPEPGQCAKWKTETRHPLSDRLIEKGDYLYGVRFGKKTNYILLDIDIGSYYHIKHDPFAIRRLLEALEALGITHSLKLFSSYSGGIHIYLPLAKAQKCSSLALAIALLIEHAGFKIAPGQLEIFPDPKPYLANSHPPLYAAHRLPLQSGSYLLTDGWEPMYSSQSEFVRRWQFCAEQNEVTAEAIQQTLKTYQRRNYNVSTKAAKFLNDLQTEIEQGWTGYGQTNRLLGRIAMREYIFGHILAGVSPLEGNALVQQIVNVATSLPGYSEYCRHQHEINKRAEDWARSVERSRYFHYGSKSSTLSTLKPQDDEEKLSWNEQQSQTAREKIRQAIAHMLNEGILPTQTTQRFIALLQYHISPQTLYRHRDLWHPDHLQDTEIQPVEIPPIPPGLIESGFGQSLEDCPRLALNFLSADGCNTLTDNDLSHLLQPGSKSGCNVHDEQFGIFERTHTIAMPESIEDRRRIRLEKHEKQHRERMQRYLESGDPILMAEAIAWFRVNGNGSVET